MAVVIGEIVTETVVQPSEQTPPVAEPRADIDVEVVVRRAAERVLEILRREWDR